MLRGKTTSFRLSPSSLVTVKYKSACTLKRSSSQKEMAMIFSRLGNAFPRPISKFFGQLEQEMETVIRVLQPGPLGVLEHKFSVEEIREANLTVRKAVENWRSNARLEQRNDILIDYIRN